MEWTIMIRRTREQGTQANLTISEGEVSLDVTSANYLDSEGN